MSSVISWMIVLLFSLGLLVPSAMAQVERSPQTIKGDVYVIKDIFGRLVYLYADKNTKRERMLVPGERVVALRPVK